MLAGLFLKKFKNYSARGKRSLLGGLGLARSWRNRSSSLVGLERLAGDGDTDCGQGKGDVGRSALGGDSVPWGTSTGALGAPGGKGAGITAEGGKASVVGGASPC